MIVDLHLLNIAAFVSLTFFSYFVHHITNQQKNAASRSSSYIIHRPADVSLLVQAVGGFLPSSHRTWAQSYKFVVVFEQSSKDH